VRRRKREQDEVQLNMAAMLDMAFQLLTFFVLTYRPGAIEGQIDLRMPPPQAITGMAAAKPAGATVSTEPVEGVDTLVITIVPTQEGNIAALRLSRVTQSTEHNDIEPAIRTGDRQLEAVSKAWEAVRKELAEKRKAGADANQVRELEQKARQVDEELQQARLLLGLEDTLVPEITRPDNPWKQVLLQVGDTLKYDALMKVVERCSSERFQGKLSKLTFVAAPSG